VTATEYDLLVRGALSPGGELVDIAIAGGRLAQIGAALDPATARECIDALGLHLLPGGIDPHVHFNEPGPRTSWEGWATGSQALAAGGVTTTLEMPLNATPPTTDVDAFDAKLAAARAQSRVDFGLWGGIVPGNLDQIEPLADRGVIGFKAFMSDTGVEDFTAVDDLTLYEAMVAVAGLAAPLPVAVHAESNTITRRLARRALAAGQTATRDYLNSRPALAETEAIKLAIELATETGCPLHIVHVSTGRGAALVAEARARQVDVTCEVTAHHLVLTEEDAERLGALAKCAPPLRSRGETDVLWRALADAEIAFVVSDHSPSPPELRAGDAFSAWGGIAGCQSTLELLLTEGYGRSRLSLEQIAHCFAYAAGRRYRLEGKGLLQDGADADLALVRLGESRDLDAGELRYRHPLSPYVGRSLDARVVTTILRGQPIYADRQIVGEPGGRLVTPTPLPAQNPSR
jgi:allantoinase